MQPIVRDQLFGKGEVVMKRFRIACLIASILMVAVFSGNAFAAKKVVVIPGISEATVAAMESYDLLIGGIKEGLATAGIVPDFHYVELDSLSSEEDVTRTSAPVSLANWRAQRATPPPIP